MSLDPPAIAAVSTPVKTISGGACSGANACSESFWARLKVTFVYRRRFRPRAEAKQAIFQYIEVFYNRVRRTPLTAADQPCPSA